MRRIPLPPRLVPALAALVALVATAAAAPAQQITGFSLSAGLLHYDLDGTGNAPAAALRAELPLSDAVMLEPGVMVSRLELDSGNERWLVLPQSLVQLRIHAGGGVEPYVGGGAGIAIGFEGEGGDDVDVMLTGATGVRIDSGGLLGFVIDARGHAIGFDADAYLIEFTVGVRFRR